MRKVFQFEHATVIYTEEMSPAAGQVVPKLFVQAIDQYHFQREWTLVLKWEPGNSTKLFWESHVYQHPGQRKIVTVGTKAAGATITRFLDLCERYPALLFNKTGEHETDKARPRHEGFVHFCEQLHRGASPHDALNS